MEAQFCAYDGCYEVRSRGARSLDFCGSHYRSEVLAKAEGLMTCEVLVTDTGSRGEVGAVTDAITGADVFKGGTVTLDPAETNVAALVAGGAVRVIPPKKAAAEIGRRVIDAIQAHEREA